MEKIRKRRVSMVRLFAELIEDTIILIFLELKLALFEIKRNIHSAERGAAMMGAGVGLLICAGLAFIGTAVAVLAEILPVWLSGLIVSLALAFLGVALLFSGLGHLKNFSLIPNETLERVEDITEKVKKVGVRHEEREARSAAPRTRRSPDRSEAA
jgi:fatty acid desaturase